MNKLYKVKVSYDTVVLAPSREEAEKEAEKNWHEIPEATLETYANEITCIDDLPEDWDKHCIPWGGDASNIKTINELL